MRNSVSSKKKNWKYSKITEKLRLCQSCSNLLEKDEAYICTKCYIELLKDIPEDYEVVDDEIN